MSQLERLTIRGIRNFGVDAGDEQKIVFSTPLTLILGANGCGKTTIIECIKYALTGELPPNCKDGRSFINNPEVSNLTESLGQVKLRFKTLKGSTTTICRSAKVFKKNQKSQFKTLDATITVEENGREANISKRNNDATEDMCTGMGVSKAIINNVLFCHQEEANWPLSTDQELMTKFDKIFGTSEYNNALDKMRQMRKQYESEIKDKKITLKELEMVKHEADRFQLEIQKQQEEKVQLDEEINDCKQRSIPMTEQLKQIQETEKRFSNITKHKTMIETQLLNAEKNAEKVSNNIVDLFPGDIDELKTKIEEFNEEQLLITTELTEEEQKLKRAKREDDEIQKQIADHDRKYHTKVAERRQEQELYAKRAEQIKQLCTSLDIAMDFDVENDNERAVSLIPSIRTAISTEGDRITEIERNNERIDAEQEKEVRIVREEEIRINSEVESIRKQLTTTNDELKKQQDVIKIAQENRRKLQDLSLSISRVHSTLETMIKNANTDELRDEIGKSREERERLNTELEHLDEQIQELNSFATILADVTAKEKHIEKREGEMRRIKNKHHESLKKIFPNEVIQSKFKQKIESLGQQLRTEINRLEAEIRRRDSLVSNLKNNQRNKKQQIAEAETEKIKLEDEIDKLCESDPFEEVLAKTKENTAKLQMENSSLKSSELFYKKYIKNVEDQPCCPLCHKDLNRNEAGDLTTELHEEIERLPQKIERTGKELKDESMKLEKLLGLQPKVERLESLRTDLIPKHRSELEKVNGELVIAQEKIKQAEEAIKEPREKSELLTTMIGDMSVLDDIIKEIERCNQELTALRSTLPEAQNDVNLEALQRTRKEKYDRAKELEKEITTKEKRMNDDITSINKLKDKEMELRSKELQLQPDAQNLPNYKARAEELQKQIQEMQSKKEENEQALVPVKAKIRETEAKRQQIKFKNNDKLKKEKDRVDKIKGTYTSMDGTTKELDRIAVKNLQAEIDRFQEKIRALNAQKTEKTNIIETIRANINAFNKKIADQEKADRNLRDNLELKNIRVEIEKKQKELDLIKRDERELDTERLMKQRADLSVELKSLFEKIAEHEGQKKEKDKAIDRIKGDLAKPKYRDGSLNYQKALYENVVQTKIVQDLTTYCETLERALTKFHSEKMAKINRLIRELWRSIYKGNDIDYIQINTEEVKGTAKRRSYTYRVVASKNDTFMDFRGQSSAGQRVLACLIIRIALAETFSGNCGVLALDEPTTNLDRINIESLCNALNRLVEERSGQSNFMLIVITHDNEFIEAMERISSYWKISRDENGKSKTEKLRVR